MTGSGIWTQTLFSAAEFSNILSAVGVLICFTCMVVFILKVQDVNLNPSSVVHIDQPVVQVEFKKVEVPFTCSFIKTDSVKELHLRVKSNVPSQLQALWAVPAENLKTFLYLPWDDFKNKCHIDNSLGAHSVQSIKIFKEADIGEEQILIVNIADDLPPLGVPPRLQFPLVLRMVRMSSNEEDPKENVGALISIFHLSDEFCPMPSTLLYHYIKQQSGQVTRLQHLFTQRPERNDTEEESEDGFCIVCRVMPPTLALLPCRHVCLCSLCFDRMKKCPMCQAAIVAFFVTNSSEDNRQRDIGQMETEQDRSNLLRHQGFLNNMNNVLNRVLGIRN